MTSYPHNVHDITMAIENKAKELTRSSYVVIHGNLLSAFTSKINFPLTFINSFNVNDIQQNKKLSKKQFQLPHPRSNNKQHCDP
jgi:hypothetical protein